MHWQKVLVWLRRALFILGPPFIIYLLCLNHIEPSQVGIARNAITGDVWLQKDGGWYLTAPWTRVARIDTRPMRVAMTTSGRGYSAKLVQFVPEHWKEFIEVEGFRYYWWSNRYSYNGGYAEEYRGLRDVFRGHGYGAKKYPFLVITREFDSP